MQAIEFSGTIEGGVIRLPEQYSNYNNQNARVILLIQPQEKVPSQKKRLATIFQKMKSKKMFRKISDPLAWQKQLRNEWD